MLPKIGALDMVCTTRVALLVDGSSILLVLVEVLAAPVLVAVAEGPVAGAVFDATDGVEAAPLVTV